MLHPPSIVQRMPAPLMVLLMVSPLLMQQEACAVDEDGDGSPSTEDCDDQDPDTYPGAPELCDGRDNDCDADVDEQPVAVKWYRDADGDGYGTSSDVVENCDAPEGYVNRGGDCDDSAQEIHPGAVELEDGLDNDCDGAIDETAFEATAEPGWYRDADGDGFGSPSDSSAVLAEGYVQVRGDCDDLDADVHPGAPDPAGDLVDRDCGGFDDSQPSVGLEASLFASIQDALSAAVAGETVWVGPGTWLEHDIRFGGKATALRSTHFARATIIDAGGLGRGFQFDAAEGPDTLLDGLTITGGYIFGGYGGGVYIYEASPTIEGCIISGNVAEARPQEDWVVGGIGGGVYAYDSSSHISGCTVSENLAMGAWVEYVSCDIYGSCGPAYAYAGGAGGGIAIRGASGGMMLEDCELASNTAVLSYPDRSYGGGLDIDGSDPSIQDCDFQMNQADAGGALRLQGSDATVTRCTFRRNTAVEYGGAVYLTASRAELSNCLFVGNEAPVGGGACVRSDSSALTAPVFSQCTFVSNTSTAGVGGALYTAGAATRLVSSILAFNSGCNLYVFESSSTPYPSISSSDVYNPYGCNVNIPELDGLELTVDPRFVTFSPDGDVENDDLHLGLDSPLRDAGAVNALDPDGTRADQGVYGGEEAEFSYYDDRDGDGQYDGWEQRQGLDPDSVDDGEDMDGDGLANGLELLAHTDPGIVDGDADGAMDGAEVAAGKDPLDWYSQPDVEGVAVARVPEDFATIQDAVASAWHEGIIAVAAGTYQEQVKITGRSITLYGTEGSDATILEGAGDSVVQASDAVLALRGLTLTGGDAEWGGGLRGQWISGTLTDLEVTDNQAADSGGGVYLSRSDVDIEHCIISQNHAPAVESSRSVLSGAGLYLEATGGTMSGSEITANEAQGSGGGIYYTGEFGMRLEGCTVAGNTASYGGGLLLDSANDPVIFGTVFQANTATSHGGGIYAAGGAAAMIQNTLLSDNRADFDGAGIYGDSADLKLVNCLLQENSAGRQGGAVYMSHATLSLEQSVLARNTAANGGGLYLSAYYEELTVSGSILAYNAPYNLYRYAGNATITYSDLFNPEGEANHNLTDLGPSNLTLEPGFLHYDGDGLPDDYHLELSSPLVDAGDPSATDVDGSRADQGMYGGAAGVLWDIDRDGFPNWFWPGQITDAPEGFDPASFDCDDNDSTVPAVNGCAATSAVSPAGRLRGAPRTKRPPGYRPAR